MKYIDLTFPSPAENLACDEALLDLSEAGAAGEWLRVWESATPFVVLGYANRAASEANLEACKAHGIRVFRRCSGGGTVLQGPGCLSYSLILKIHETGPSRSIAETNRFIMGRHQAALARLLKKNVRIEGHTDLAVDGRKFSGNAQRRKRRALIFHGTFLLHFDLNRIETFLRPPTWQPDYRQSRPHAAFLTNLPLEPAAVKSALRQAWQVDELAHLGTATDTGRSPAPSPHDTGVGRGLGRGETLRTTDPSVPPLSPTLSPLVPHGEREENGHSETGSNCAPGESALDLPLANFPELVHRYSSDGWNFKI